MRSFILSFLILATAGIQIGDSEDPGALFGKIMERAAERLQNAAEYRSLKLASWNDSIEKMAAAVRGMAVKADPAEITGLLEESRKYYEKNNFSYLLEAILLNSHERQQEADEKFETFLLKSRTFSEFEETFIRWGEFHMLRRIVYEILKAHGVSFKGREKEIQVRIPYEAFFRYVMNPEREDWGMNLLFVTVILAGGVLLLLAGFRGINFTTTYLGTFSVAYLIVWISYGFWIFDLAIGFPFKWNRVVVIPAFLLISTAALFLLELAIYLKEKSKPLEEGYKRCPYCKKPIVILAIECTECRKKL